MENAMVKYHSLFHQKGQFENLAIFRGDIARLSALYIAKRKEKCKTAYVNSRLSDLKNFFIPKRDISLINNKILEQRAKVMIQSLYQNHDIDT